ncbi:MAG: peptidoglycan bridge formation glycyltransferase FemA/FemB family protein [Candidatus Pacebacteria bacterium]|nr:peptidoglycan bridge formation glycyltransferase FemA/FemB family protein [Candidatus Paceibacterota bacterium]
MERNHFLQSQEWADFQKSLNLNRAFFNFNMDGLKSIYQKNNFPFGFNYFYFPRGLIFKKEINKLELDNFINLFKQGTRPLNKSISLKIEPNENYSKELEDILKSSGFKKAKSIQPEETIIIDLEKSEDELLREMEHDTRYAIRYANRQGVQVIRLETIEDKKKYFEDFWNIFKETNSKHTLRIYKKSYYENFSNLNGKLKSYIYLAQINGQNIASAIFLSYGSETFYMFAGSRTGFAKFNAPSLIIWTAIRDFKLNGFKSLDLWGISDTNAKWLGVTRFKRGFRGKSIKYMGTWEYPLNKFYFYLFNLIKFILRR